MRYFTTPSGSIATRDELAFVPREGWVEISRNRYLNIQDAQVAANNELLAEQVAARTARAEQDYTEMIAAGVPERVARRLSGTVA